MAITHISSAQSRPLFKWARWVGIALLLIYFLRGTVLSWYLHIPESVWMGLTTLALMLGIGISAMGGGKWRWLWIGVVLSFAMSIPLSEQPVSAGLHWLGIAWLVLAVGPAIQNAAAIQLRASAWKLLTSGMTILAAILTVWYLLHLPCPAGRAPFAGFMNQSMLLGPIVGMGAAITLAHALYKRSWKWALLAFLALIPLLAAGSRLAVVATGVTCCFLIFRRKPLLGMVCVVTLGLAIFTFISLGHREQVGNSFTGFLAYKGDQNTRANLWQSRIDEFISNPLIGIGVAMGTGSGSERGSDGTIRVEPGSSYLALLAMTGAVGTLMFFSALIFLIYRFYVSKTGDAIERDILGAIGIYMGVHGIGEGWILGFGSPLCFIFWLWLGRFADVAAQPPRIRQQFRRYRRLKPAMSVAVKR